MKKKFSYKTVRKHGYCVLKKGDKFFEGFDFDSQELLTDDIHYAFPLKNREYAFYFIKTNKLKYFEICAVLQERVYTTNYELLPLEKLDIIS